MTNETVTYHLANPKTLRFSHVVTSPINWPAPQLSSLDAPPEPRDEYILIGYSWLHSPEGLTIPETTTDPEE